MKVIVITQARMGSTRLPEKILKKIGNSTLLKIHLDRIKKAQNISEVIVATTINKEDDLVDKYVKNLGFRVFRGSENDVLDRFYQSVKKEKPELIVRLTSDCPLIDPKLIDYMVDMAIKNKVDYCSNTLLETFPDGQDIEVFTFKALEKAWKLAKLASEREHVTPFIKKNSSFYSKNLFSAKNVESLKLVFKDVRMTVDEQEDLDMITLLIETLGENSGWEEYAKLYLNNKTINSLNKNIVRNEGYLKSIRKETNN